MAYGRRRSYGRRKFKRRRLSYGKPLRRVGRSRPRKMSSVRSRLRRRRSTRTRAQVTRFDTLKGFGKSLSLTVHSQKTVVISTDGTASDSYCVAFNTYAAPSATLDHSTTFPHTATATPINDLRYWLFDSFASALDTRVGILPAILMNFSFLMVKGVKLMCRLEPSDNAFASNNIALWAAEFSPQQTAGSVPQTTSGLTYDYLRLMPKGKVAVSSMPSSIVAGAATQHTMQISRYFSAGKVNPIWKKDPEQYNQAITGQMSTVGSLSMGGPALTVGAINVGICSKDGASFATTTIIGRLTVRATIYVTVYAPMVYAGVGGS